MLILVFCVILGISYAYLSIFLTSNKENIVKVGDLSLILDETSSNGITLENGVAITDEEGLTQEGASFSLKNNGKAYVCYKLYLDDKDLSSGETRVDDKLIKFSLDKDNEVGTAQTLPTIGTNPNRLLDEGTIDSGVTLNYKLRLWFNSEIDANYSGQVFKGKLRVEATQCEKLPTVSVSEQLLAGVGKNGAIDTSDSEQTFITGIDPNNYIWYSGKLWRAVSVDLSDNTIKLITNNAVSSSHYDDTTAIFSTSDIKEWLNDTTVDGFLGNLREPEKFIKMDSTWNATQTSETTKPPKTTMVTSAVGLLNAYEYTMSYNNTTFDKGYLNNEQVWWIMTSISNDVVQVAGLSDNTAISSNKLHRDPKEGILNAFGIRPVINLQSSVEFASGTGTASDPYRLKGDNDAPVSGTKLATRYSGEYIRFGTGENNLYQIVSHEVEGTTKIISATSLKEDGEYKEIAFDESGDTSYSDSNTIGAFLNGEYLRSGSYLTTDQVNMIENDTTWYLGVIESSANYKLAKYINTSGTTLTSNRTTATIGLPRFGELYSYLSNEDMFWSLTSSSGDGDKVYMFAAGVADGEGGQVENYGMIRPSMFLKSNVIITGGDGTKDNPFEVALAS